MTIDGLGASPAVDITYDKTAPSLGFTAPSGAAGTIVGATGPTYTVTFNAKDIVAKFGASAPWTLKRQIARNTGGGTCDPFADDGTVGSVVTGTVSATAQTSSQSVSTGKCYRWILSATDLNGNAATPVTSATLIVDGTDPAMTFVAPYAPTVTGTGTSYKVAWLESENGSGVSTRSLQRYKVASIDPTCGGAFLPDGTADAGISPLTQTLTAGNCYRWTQTLTDKALGRLVTTVLPGDSSQPALTTATVYNEYGSPLTESDSWTPSGGTLQTRTTTHTYDALDRETQVADPAGVTTLTTIDVAGNAVETRVDDPSSTNDVTTTRTFDAKRQLQSEATGSADHSKATGYAYSTLGLLAATSHELQPPPTDPEKQVTLTRKSTTDLRGLVTKEEVGTADVTPLTTTHTFDKLGNELAVDDPDPASSGGDVDNTYDRLGRLLTTTTGSRTTTYTYDRAGNQLTVTDPAGIVTTTTYDPLNRATVVVANDVASPTLPTDDVTTRTYYDAAGNVTAVKDAAGFTTRTILNVRDQASSTTTDCTDTGTTPTSNPAACTGAGMHDDTTNVTTQRIYDGQGNVVKETAAVGRPAEAVTETAYDNAGKVVAIKDPRGTITRNVYNQAGQLTDTYRNCTTSGTTIPTSWTSCTGGGTADGTYNIHTSYAYDDQGRQAMVTGPNGRMTVSVYDEGGNVAATIDNYVDGTPGTTDDITTERFYDGYGRLDDSRGNRVVVTSPDPSATSGTSTGTVAMQSAFDAAGRLCRVVENATGSTNLQTLSNPCTDATQTSGTATTNLSTRYAYDGIGNMTSMTDAAGHTTTYSYDALSHPTGRTDADGGALVWAYDAMGNRISQRNRTDTAPTLSVTWTYDPMGRQLTRVADSVTTSYTYDLDGNKLTASDGSYTITATYDRLDRVLTVDDEDAGTTADTTYTYSLTSPSWTDPSGSYGATLDKFDRQLTFDEPADTGTSNLTFTYRSDGGLSSLGWPNGNTTDLVYDKLGHLTSKNTTASGGTVNRALYAWTYNRAGQVLTEAETVTGGSSNGSITYAYDPLGQLTGSTLSGTTTSYGWDKVPNRTSVQVGAGTAATTSYDAADRPTSGSNPTASYSSNADGMLTARPGQTLIWDHLGRLKQVKDAAGTTTLASYTYDPLDRLRTAADTAGARVRFRYTGMTTSVAQWWDDVAGTVTRSVGNDWSGERQLDWTGSNSNIRYYGTNAHHDVTWLSGTAGTVSQSLRYDPFGNARTTVPTGYTPFRFQGSWYDGNSDLSWVVTRWYAPTLGRFISEDSLLGQPADPDSRHLYAYAAGDPVGAWDPDGRLATNSAYYDRYGTAQSKWASKRFNNLLRLRGVIVIADFIPSAYVDGFGWRFQGDARSFTEVGLPPDCLHSRACIWINFDTSTVSVVVRPSCGARPRECEDANDLNPLGIWQYNSFDVNTASDDCRGIPPIRMLFVDCFPKPPTMVVKWTLRDSFPKIGPILAPSFAIDGRLRLQRGDHYLRYTLSGDRYPNIEMYYRVGGLTKIAEQIRNSGNPADLASIPGFANFKIDRVLDLNRGRANVAR